MGLTFEYPDGATPLGPDEMAGLIPAHITTQGQLNEWEFANIARAEAWLLKVRQKEVLTIEFAQLLHRRMFDDTWEWAGRLRQHEIRPIGSSPEQIRPNLHMLFQDVATQIQYRTYSIEEGAARLHHRLVQIHPFANGNGRFARTLTDLHLKRCDRPSFSWGGHLEQQGEARARYIAALRAADAHDYAPLLELLVIQD